MVPGLFHPSVSFLTISTFFGRTSYLYALWQVKTVSWEILNNLGIIVVVLKNFVGV